MDPNLAQNLKLNYSNRKIYLIAIAGAVIIILSLLAFFYLRALNKPVKPEQQTPTPIPTPTAIPPKIKMFPGIIVSVNKEQLTLKIGTETKTFSYSDNLNIQKAILEGGFTQTVPSSLADLKTGQEVQIVIDEVASLIISVLILK